MFGRGLNVGTSLDREGSTFGADSELSIQRAKRDASSSEEDSWTTFSFRFFPQIVLNSFYRKPYFYTGIF